VARLCLNRRHLDGGDCLDSRLAIGDCHQLRADMRSRGHKLNTIRYARSVLRKPLRQAEREGLIPRVAALSAAARIGQSKGRSPTVDQAHSLLSAATTNRLEACYHLMLGYGLRRGEAPWPAPG
jgi:hypothetical protein